MGKSEHTSSNVISSDQVEGTAVYSASGDKLGSIDDLMIDKLSGQIRFVVLEFGGFLGIGSDRYPLPWQALKYDTRLEGYIVPIDKSLLEKGPRYPLNEVPQYDEYYGNQINKYYGADL